MPLSKEQESKLAALLDTLLSFKPKFTFMAKLAPTQQKKATRKSVPPFNTSALFPAPLAYQNTPKAVFVPPTRSQNVPEPLEWTQQSPAPFEPASSKGMLLNAAPKFTEKALRYNASLPSQESAPLVGKSPRPHKKPVTKDAHLEKAEKPMAENPSLKVSQATDAEARFKARQAKLVEILNKKNTSI